MMSKIPYCHKGNENLFLAVEMSLISTLAGIPLHVHAEGLRGTGKTTVMRCAGQFLPRITRIKDCLYQCEPERPHCPRHSAPPPGAPVRWETEEIPMPFVEIGHAAKLGSVVGSIDLARLTDPAHPEAHLLPGTIPQASRGIVFVDEINRLAETAPEITDVLLSVMGTKPGKLRIEETGLPPVELEVSASVWAASNPDEDPGPLEHVRRQLADRFDLVVAVNRPSDPDVVERMLMRREEDYSPEGRKANDSVSQGGDYPVTGEGVRERAQSRRSEPASTPSASNHGGSLMTEPFQNLQEKARRFRNVTVGRPILRYIAELYVTKNIESLRAAEALELCSRLAAAIQGRNYVIIDDLTLVAPMVLRHRVEPFVLAEILKDMEARKLVAGMGTFSHRSRGNTPSSAGPSSPSSQERDGRDNGCPPDAGLGFGLLKAGDSRGSGGDLERAAAAYHAGSDPVRAGQGSSQRLSRGLSQGPSQGLPHGQSQEGCPDPPGPPSGEAGTGKTPQREGFLGRLGRLFQRWAEPGTQASVPSPLRTLPLSPPDPARPLSLIRWEEMILPGAWRVVEEELREGREP
ncbi:MAG TPA: hypothetical protein GX510_05955 [Firmicutes bacterium]|nr:hypothetical protein [Candidatus Fermentithermobacillaceae bacterium]